jgi:hypothetical protein
MKSNENLLQNWKKDKQLAHGLAWLGLLINMCKILFVFLWVLSNYFWNIYLLASQIKFTCNYGNFLGI